MLPKQRIANQDGIALMLVLWVMVLITAIVAEFAYSMRTEVNITNNFKQNEEAYYAAIAGIEQAKAELLSAGDKMYLDEQGNLIISDDSKVPERKGRFGNTVYSYEIVDEDRKLNINSADAEQLRYIFKNSGVEGEGLDTIIDSIFDWRDADNLHRLNGAEEDYYQSLEEPYSCKDSSFDIIEELLLVKGITPEILYGPEKNKDSQYKGAAQYLTAKSSGMVNINTADRVVLEAKFGITAAGNIMVQRSTGQILVPVAGGDVKSRYFSIISTGRSNNTKRAVKAVFLKKDDKTIETLYWNDNFVHKGKN
ncbi:MAG: hypothetical protein AB1610_11815 [Nitrospirota bacterium]